MLNGELHVVIGKPVRKIVSIAEKGAYGPVIMGTHGHGKSEEAIIGSEASEVIRTSTVPVRVVRLPENKK
jgi:ACR3 family arsenite transporter